MVYSVTDKMNFWKVKTGQIFQTKVFVSEVYFRCGHVEKLWNRYFQQHQNSWSEGDTTVYPSLQKSSYRWSLVRDQITDMLRGYIGKILLAELITVLINFKRNVYWWVGWRLKYHNESFGLQGLKTSQVRRHCFVCGLTVAKRNAAILSEG